VNVALAKSAGNVNVLFEALNATVQAAVLPAIEHVEADVLARWPTSLGRRKRIADREDEVVFTVSRAPEMRAVMAAIHRPIRCAGIAVRERHLDSWWSSPIDSADCERDGRRLPIDPDRCLVGPHCVAQDIGPCDRKLQLALFTVGTTDVGMDEGVTEKWQVQRRIASRAGRRPGIDPRGSDYQRQQRRLHPAAVVLDGDLHIDRRRLALREPLDLLPGRSDRDSTIHGHSVDRRSPSVDEDLTGRGAAVRSRPPPVSVATMEKRDRDLGIRCLAPTRVS